MLGWCHSSSPPLMSVCPRLTNLCNGCNGRGQLRGVECVPKTQLVSLSRKLNLCNRLIKVCQSVPVCRKYNLCNVCNGRGHRAGRWWWFFSRCVSLSPSVSTYVTDVTDVDSRVGRSSRCVCPRNWVCPGLLENNLCNGTTGGTTGDSISTPTLGGCLPYLATHANAEAAASALGETCLIWQPIRMLRLRPLHWERHALFGNPCEC